MPVPRTGTAPPVRAPGGSPGGRDAACAPRRSRIRGCVELCAASRRDGGVPSQAAWAETPTQSASLRAAAPESTASAATSTRTADPQTSATGAGSANAAGKSCISGLLGGSVLVVLWLMG